jgi:hypothetical protein
MHDEFSPNSLVPFATSFRQDDGTLIDATTPRVVFVEAIAGVTSVTLTKEATGHFSADWLVPAAATIGQIHHYYYAGSFAPYTGAAAEEWQSTLLSLKIVSAARSTSSSATTTNHAVEPHALTTILAVKAVVGDNSYTDARIRQLISSLTDAFESYCGRNFGYTVVPTTAREEYQGHGRPKLLLRRFPIASVAQVRENGSAIDNYDRNAEFDYLGILYRTSLWAQSAPTFGDVTQDADTTRRAYNYDVAYAAGYVLPQYRQVATITNGSAAVSALTDTLNLPVGMYVVGNGIPTGTTILAVPTGTTITLSANATTSSTVGTLTFYAAGATPPTTVTRLPFDLEQACIDEVVDRLQQPMRGLSSERLTTGDSQSYRSRTGGFLQDTLGILDRYVRRG